MLRRDLRPGECFAYGKDWKFGPLYRVGPLGWDEPLSGSQQIPSCDTYDVTRFDGPTFVHKHSDEATTDPKHYRDLVPEPIDVIEGWKLGYRLGNVIKYLARADHKGARLKDLMKARWYLDREIAKCK